MQKIVRVAVARRAHIVRPLARRFPAAPLLPQRRWESSTPAEDFFSAVDDSTFKTFSSKQVNLVREKDGRRCSMIPMQHVASRHFYNEVLQEVAGNKYYLVLIEGLLESVEQLKQEDRLALRIASDPAFKNKMEAMVKASEHYSAAEEESLFENTMIPFPPPSDLDLAHQELYFKPHLLCNSPLKVKNSDVTRDRILSITDEDERNFFIRNGRTDHCAKVLRAYLDTPLQEYNDCPGADAIAVCWGHAHCKHLIDDLLTRGFTIESEGPVRDYGWTEDLYNEVARRWKASHHSFDPIIGLDI